jgi:hypothetical protein
VHEDRLRAAGLRDIDNILAYIHKRSPRGAHSVSLAIEHTIHLCALNPVQSDGPTSQICIGGPLASTATQFSTGSLQVEPRLLGSSIAHE